MYVHVLVLYFILEKVLLLKITQLYIICTGEYLYVRICIDSVSVLEN